MEIAQTIEEFWTNLYKDRNPHLVTTLVSFSLHEFFYFTRFLPFLLCDFLPSMQKYKIQKKHTNTREDYIKCLKHLAFSQFCVQLPMQLLFHPVAEKFGMKITSGPIPSIWDIVYQVLIFMIFEDAWQYWFHRFLHHPVLYKHIHKLHHEFQAPFGITAEYAHPLETLILGFGTIGGPLIYVYATGDLHILTVFVWLIVRLFQTVDAHSGYDFPISLHHYLPIWGGADFHDHHHMVFLGNYGSSFRIWDWICKTDTRYNKYKANLKQQQNAKQTLTKEE